MIDSREMFPGERAMLVVAATLLGPCFATMFVLVVFMGLWSSPLLPYPYPESVAQATSPWLGVGAAVGAGLGFTLSWLSTRPW